MQPFPLPFGSPLRQRASATGTAPHPARSASLRWTWWTALAVLLGTLDATVARVHAQAASASASTAASVAVEKVMPPEVLLGKPFEFVITVKNLGDVELQDVILTDRTEGGARVEEATPKATSVDGATSTWSLGTLGARQTREMRIRALATAETPITGCATATFRPTACTTSRVVRPAIELVKTMPAEALLCDAIPVRLTVKNSGTSALNDVRVTDALPAGLALPNGETSRSFEAGRLLPGQSRDFEFTVKAARTGSFANPAKASSAEGAEAAAQATVNIVQPVLSVACQTPPLRSLPNVAEGFAQFIGRPFEVCWEVGNTGNAVSADSQLEVALPAGVEVRSTTEGGSAASGRITWKLGSLAAGATKKVCATLVAANAGSYAFEASTRGACAIPASTRCTVPIQGVNAILVELVDDPDPIQVGEKTTYTVRITNQGGGLDLRDIAVKAVFPDGLQPATASNGGQIQGKTVTWAPVPALALQKSITYTVVGTAQSPGDHRLEVLVTTQSRQQPITEFESTTAY